MVSKGAEKQDDSMSATKYRQGKKVAFSTPYKSMYTFASLLDSDEITFVIMEESVEMENVFFNRDLSRKDFRIGERFAILLPTLMGSLKSGARIISTDLPFERLSGPSIPIVLPRDRETVHDQRYFVVKSTIINGGEPLVLKTTCTADACDRQGSDRPVKCGCYCQFTRSGSTARQTVLRFRNLEIIPQGGSENILIEKFISLRTSRLLFSGLMIPLTTDQLNNGFARARIQHCWKSLLLWVNNNGGWTVVGSYLRAHENSENVGEGADGNSLRQSVTHKLVYMYPTNVDIATIPVGMQIRREDVVDGPSAVAVDGIGNAHL